MEGLRLHSDNWLYVRLTTSESETRILPLWKHRLKRRLNLFILDETIAKGEKHEK
jgi:hypothetical protein